jgi:hypothetical protein
LKPEPQKNSGRHPLTAKDKDKDKSKEVPKNNSKKTKKKYNNNTPTYVEGHIILIPLALEQLNQSTI